MDTVFFIAELGLNHNGDLELAKDMVSAAAEAGANAVKFQSIRAEKLVSTSSLAEPISGFRLEGVRTAGDFWRKVSIDARFHREISAFCQRTGVEFMSTPFDLESADLLVELGVKRLKIASGDLTHYPLLAHVGRSGKQVILSTGASTLAEVKGAVEYLKGAGCEDLVLLHCVSLYPTPATDANLQAIRVLRESFGCRVGYSDHTLGVHAPLAAIALGAVVVEKHFTVDKNLPGPDQGISADPAEFSSLVRFGREVAEAVRLPQKSLSGDEEKMRRAIRRGIVAARDLRAGETISSEMIDYKRPESGISAAEYERVLGRRLLCPVPADSPIAWSMME